MKRILLALTLAVGVLGSTLIVPETATAHHTGSHWNTFGQSGGCKVEVEANLTFGDPHSDWASLRRRFVSGSAGCPFIGMRVRIRRCDGTFSTSAEFGVFNPVNGDGPSKTYTFDCHNAGINEVWVRYSSASGVWEPGQTLGPAWIRWNPISGFSDPDLLSGGTGG